MFEASLSYTAKSKGTQGYKKQQSQQPQPHPQHTQ